MELVYLWVEEYKNIHNQGFNFSPRFNCKFHDEYDENGKLKDNCKLEIKDNPNHIENFFGENINVTAIVGKNGSGKSSVLKSFFSIWHNVYYIFIEDEQLYSNHFLGNICGKDIQKKDISSLELIHLNKMFFMELAEGGLLESFSLSNQNLYQNLFQDRLKKNKNTIDIDKFNKNILDMILAGNTLSPDYFKPKNITISFQYLTKEMQKITTIFVKYYNELGPLVVKEDKTEQEKLKYEDLIIRTSYKFRYKVYLKSLEMANGESDRYEELLNNFLDKPTSEILEYNYNFDDEHFSYIQDKDIDTFLNNFKDKDFNSSLDEFRKKYWNNNGDYIRVFLHLNKIGFLEYDFIDTRGKRFSNLSSGEKSLFLDFNIINREVTQHIKDNQGLVEDYNDYATNTLLLFIDEPDITLHPDWQKRYVKTLINLLKQYKTIDFHLIFTTHSPFLLSDIPQQNIIFLDKNEEGKCKVVDGLKEKKQTFGANIHTLLSDSFFMEDGLMGEFAKGKINEIIDFHKQVEDENKREDSNLDTLKTEYNDKKKRFWDVQSIIGEEYLKQIIKNHLVEIEKILLGKDEAKQQEIKRTETYLKSLKND